MTFNWMAWGVSLGLKELVRIEVICGRLCRLYGVLPFEFHPSTNLEGFLANSAFDVRRPVIGRPPAHTRFA
jgi:hypothetical protein